MADKHNSIITATRQMIYSLLLTIFFVTPTAIRPSYAEANMAIHKFIHLKTFDSWKVFTKNDFDAGSKKDYHIISYETNEAAKPQQVERGDAPYILLSHIKGDAFTLSYQPGVRLEEGAETIIRIQNKAYALKTHSEHATTYSSSSDKEIIFSLLKSKGPVVITTKDKNNLIIKDTFSLKGLREAVQYTLSELSNN